MQIHLSPVTDETCKKATGHGVGVEVGGWNRFYVVADLIFTPDVMAKGQLILERAAKAAKDDSLALARVSHDVRPGIDRKRLAGGNCQETR